MSQKNHVKFIHSFESPVDLDTNSIRSSGIVDDLDQSPAASSGEGAAGAEDVDEDDI